MKTDLVTSIILAIVGVVMAFLACNIFVGPIESVSFPAIGTSVNVNLDEPSPEVFNYKALNPTVEVYVGNCSSPNAGHECQNAATNNTIKNENQ